MTTDKQLLLQIIQPQLVRFHIHKKHLKLKTSAVVLIHFCPTFGFMPWGSMDLFIPACDLWVSLVSPLTICMCTAHHHGDYRQGWDFGPGGDRPLLIKDVCKLLRLLLLHWNHMLPICCGYQLRPRDVSAKLTSQIIPAGSQENAQHE